MANGSDEDERASAGVMATVTAGRPADRAVIEATLPATSAATSGLDATMMAAGSGEQPPASGIDATVASGSGSASGSPPGAPAGDDRPFDRLVTVKAANYRIERELSRGGMGRILVASDRRMGRTVALKEATIASPHARARFEREALITGRLQHPGIVPVYEAGCWPNGEPFYAMKLVEGRPLRACIEAQAELRGRLGLLPNLVAVADALSYAHARRVIHRDLKPDNVLVGDYGETVIIDWGLAKQLDDDAAGDDGGDDAAGGRTDDAPGVTVAGTALGTPVYMPPEQARGEAVDERADVYALGAMLYHLLTGRVPYHDSRSAAEVLDRVLAGPPRPVAASVPDAPPDLIAIVDKAMQRAPADRYPSARELAEDLRRYTTGQLVGAHRYSTWQLVRRWIRRHRAPVSVAALAVVTLAVVGSIGVQRIRDERAVAQANRTLAEAHRTDLEGILDFMLTDLRDKLNKLGRATLLEDVADRAAGYFEGKTSAGESADDSERRALALLNLGDAVAAMGQRPRALELFAKAARTADEALARAPRHAGLYKVGDRARLAAAHQQLVSGETKAALRQADDVLARLPAWLADEPRDLILQEAHGIRADALVTQSDRAGGLAARRQAVDAARRRLGRKPDEVLRTVDLVDALNVLARQQREDGDLDGSIATAADALALTDQALARDPAAARALEVRVRALDALADSYLAKRDLDNTLARYQDEIVAAQRLRELDPASIWHVRALAIAEEKISTALYHNNDLDGSMTHARRALELREDLITRDPDNLQFQREVTVIYDRLSLLHQQKGQVDDSLAEADRSIAIRERLVARNPDNAQWRRDLAVARFMRGEGQAAAGRADAAFADYQLAVEAFRALMALEPTVPDHVLDLSIVRHRIAMVLGGQQRYAEAEAGVSEGIAELTPVIAAHADLDRALVSQGTLLRVLAQLRMADGRGAEAIEPAQQAVALADQVVARRPLVDFQIELSGSLVFAAEAIFLAAPDRRDEAFALLDRGLALADALAVQLQDNVVQVQNLAGLRNTAVARARGASGAARAR